MKPDDDYLAKLGFAHYAIQGTTWNVVYALHYATNQSVADLAVLSQRQLANKLERVWKDDSALRPLAKSFHKLLNERNHIVHAHPATCSTTGGTGPTSQRLYRWDVGECRTGEISWVTADRLDRFASRALTLGNHIHAAWNNSSD